MAAEDTRELLQFELRSFPVTLQVHEAKEQITVVVNRAPDAEIDYDQIADLLYVKLDAMELPFAKYKIVGRVEKQAKPEWQQVFENVKQKKGGFLGGLFGGRK